MLSSQSRFASKVLLFNASPRTSCNTARVLNEIKKGAESAGATVDLVNLYKLNFKGCASCLECKRKGTPGGCHIHDDLSKYLNEAYNCTGIAIGTPVYCGNFAASYYALFERLLYSNRRYELPPNKVKFGKRINTALIYTMGVDQERCMSDYSKQIEINKNIFEETLGPCTVLNNYKQLLTPNTKPYDMGAFDIDAIHKWVKEHDPIVLKQAYELGIKLATKIPQ